MEFPFAEYLAFLVIAAGYWMISVQYEPILNILALFAACTVLYQSPWQPPHSKNSDYTQKITARLSVMSAEMIRQQIDTERLPKDPNQTFSHLPSLPDSEVHFCFQDCKASKLRPESLFWIQITDKKPRDKAPSLWYIDDSLDIYYKSPSDIAFTKLEKES